MKEYPYGQIKERFYPIIPLRLRYQNNEVETEEIRLRNLPALARGKQSDFRVLKNTPRASARGVFDTSALIDSGGLISLFQLGVAKQLGIDIKVGRPKEIEGVGGKVLAYMHKINARIAGKDIDCQIAFSEEYKASFNILARIGFFEHFIITFDEKNKRVCLE